MKRRFLLAATLPLLFAAATVSAADSTSTPPPAPPQGRPPAPPPEAVAACKGKTAGATVSFTGRGGETLSGTCESIDGVLAARPSGMRPNGPPPGQAPTTR